MIDLTNAIKIGEGNERVCYEHPNDNSKVIKVTKQNIKSREQNKIDNVYYKYLQEKDIDCSHLPSCYGYIKTTLGEGLIFDKISNYDGSDAFTFEYMLRHNLLEYEIQKKILNDLVEYIVDNNILFIDVSLPNIICHKDIEGKYRLVIIDGLGSRHLGLKFWLYRNFSFLAKRKIEKQIKKLYENFEKLPK